MTDIERFKEFYESINVDLIEEPHWDVGKKEQGIVIITLDAGEKGFDGYMGFNSIVEFAKDGSFIIQGFWE